jgi:bifunctional non-homologous end joining protein LigD
MPEELKKYREKRDFSQTPEPPPGKDAGEGPLAFVVQKHNAQALHYDLRLEFDGGLKSWAVPKGPSLDPAVKRLAVMVEDHPLDYASFEGNIPKGEYGGGEVIVWDNGTYSPDEGEKYLFNDRAAAQADMRAGLAAGKLSFYLRGSKLRGSWTLVKIQRSPKEWLLIKHADEFAGTTDVLELENSVASGRSIPEVRENKPSVSGTPQELNPSLLLGAKKAAFPRAARPMLASLAEGPFSHPDWFYEPKLDGYRILAGIRGGEVTLTSRNGGDLTRRYAALEPSLSRQPASEVLLDGEIIALDEQGRPCFGCMQNYVKSSKAEAAPLIYYVFDILYLDGYDLRGCPLAARRPLLDAVLRPDAHVRLTDSFAGEGKAVFDAAVKNGLEGVVAKRRDSLYESGKRSRDWLKVKANLSEEFVIGGYSVVEGGRAQTFSSLLLGYYDAQGKLVYAGNVGSGFNEANLDEMKKRLDSLRAEKSPFKEKPPIKDPVTWVRPELVAEVKFSEWTLEGRLRHPVFMRLREDKSPTEVHRSQPVTVEVTPDPPPAGRRRKVLPAAAGKPRAHTPSARPKPHPGSIEQVRAQLENSRENFTLEVEGSPIKLTNLGKALWPAGDGRPAISKRQLLLYLAGVSPYLLPHLKDRPLTLSRYPDGIQGEQFWQKHWGHPVPRFMTRVDISEAKGTVKEYLVCDNLASLLWLGQVANLEFHSWFSRTVAAPDMPEGRSVDHYLDYPDFIIFDLDPYTYSGRESAGAEPELNRAGFTQGAEVALRLKAVLDELHLQAFIKTSGKTGIHIHVPIKRSLDYKAVRALAETIGKYLAGKHPDDITTEWAQEKRRGKVFVDYGQNVRGKTLACVYSPRPDPHAAVSTPLEWSELGKVYPTDFTLLSLPARLEKKGDIWAAILSAKQDLASLPSLFPASKTKS